MKKALSLILLPLAFVALSGCGGKNMNTPADGSSSGPSYNSAGDDGTQTKNGVKKEATEETPAGTQDADTAKAH
jgi:hypothetical protein